MMMAEDNTKPSDTATQHPEEDSKTSVSMENESLNNSTNNRSMLQQVNREAARHAGNPRTMTTQTEDREEN